MNRWFLIFLLSTSFGCERSLASGETVKKNNNIIINGIEFLTVSGKIYKGGGDIIAPLGELGVTLYGPGVDSNGKVQFGYLANDTIIQGISIEKKRKITFHTNGKIASIHGTGKKQTIDEKLVDVNDIIEFDVNGKVKNVTKPLP